MTKIVLKLMVWIIWTSNVGSNEIGVVSVPDGRFIPKSTTDTAIKINGRKFDLYCGYVAKATCRKISKKFEI